MEDKPLSDEEAPDWLVMGVVAEVCHETGTVVALREGPVSVTLHLLPTLNSSSREQVAVAPC